MPVVSNRNTLDYINMGDPEVVTLAKTSIDPDGLDLTDWGQPFFASLGEVSTSVMRATQVVIETLRDNDGAAGGLLRATQVVREVIFANDENVYVTFVALERISRSAAQPGKLGNSWMVFDNVNHLDVTLRSGTLTSAANDLAVLNGTNAALWGAEIIGFRDVTDLTGGKYRLKGLLRGRFGTEWAMRSHEVGDEFIVLTASTIGRVTDVEASIGVGKYFRAVTIGHSIDQSTPRILVNNAAGLKPYSPCYVTSSRDGGNNLTINWIRRTRVDGELRDAVEVALGEFDERYEIDILNSVGAVVRTLTSITPTVVYSSANQTTDFGGPQSLVVVVIYQMSTVVGRGYGTTRNV